MPLSLESLTNRLRNSPSNSASSIPHDLNSSNNKCIFQGFEWHVPSDQNHWQRLSSSLDALKAIGIDEIWLPPGCKATHPNSNGYDIYDLYDIGEFDWKWSRSTKWGSKEDLVALGTKASELNIGLIWDAVLSHRAGGDQKERCTAVVVDPENRNKELGRSTEIEAYLHFEYPKRENQYSSMKYHSEHFNATDHNTLSPDDQHGILRISNKRWSKMVDTSEKGNYDFLMFNNLDYTHPDVRADVLAWAKWLPSQISALHGIRFDAARHLPTDFLKAFISELPQDYTLIAEYWQGSTPHLRAYLKRMQYKVQVFDAPLLYNLYRASVATMSPSPTIVNPTRRGSLMSTATATTNNNNDADLRKIFVGSLVEKEPLSAITIVANHDTQPGQTLHAPIDPAFSTIAYAIILLRQEGTPCVFYGDLYGIKGDNAQPPSCGGKLPDLILARKLFAYGRQRDYFDERNCIGWTREGNESRPNGCAVLIRNKEGTGSKRMFVGMRHGGEEWSELWEWEREGGKVRIDNGGWGEFSVDGIGFGVWVKGDAEGRNRLGQFDANIYGH